MAILREDSSLRVLVVISGWLSVAVNVISDSEAISGADKLVSAILPSSSLLLIKGKNCRCLDCPSDQVASYFIECRKISRYIQLLTVSAAKLYP